MSGVKDVTLNTQLSNFQIAFADTFFAGEMQSLPKSWLEAFHQMRMELQKVPQGQKIILFFDELPWLASPKSGFLEALDHLWNRYLSRMDNVILIVCGSAAAWMVENIIYDTGGLYGRLSKEIRLTPFTLSEVEQYLRFKNINLNRKQIVEMYFAMGGVAKYLNNARTGSSAAQIINENCFTAGGSLYDEFNKLYRSLFNNFQNHIKIVRALAGAPRGLERDALLKKANIASGGTATKLIDELLQSGFILNVPQYDSKMSLYKLIDPYSLFYLHWMQPARMNTLGEFDSEFWLKQYGKPAWFSWAGLAFENTCMMEVEKIKRALGISGIATQISTWQYRANSPDEKGAQIDLVIDRADQCINLCEIKFCDQEFVITKEYAEALDRKKQIFESINNPKKALFTTMITTYGVKENAHYHDCVQKQITLDDLFEA